MGGLKGIGSFAVVLGAFALGLRLIHMGVPMIVPETRSGPYEVAGLEAARQEAGFAPLTPSYRPAVLGAGAPSITFCRIPRPTLTLEWRGRNRLLLTQSAPDGAPALPEDAIPLAGVPDTIGWSRGATRHFVLERAGVRVRGETDLPEEDLRRIAVTLGAR